MFQLYGVRCEESCVMGVFVDHDIRILIATFDTKEAAKAYVEASFVPPGERLNKRRPYHPASVLGAYTDYEIEEGAGIPHNPVRNW